MLFLYFRRYHIYIFLFFLFPTYVLNDCILSIALGHFFLSEENFRIDILKFILFR